MKSGDIMQAVIYHKQCAICGKPFDAHNDRAKYCSRDCAKERYKRKYAVGPREMTCPVCGKKFTNIGKTRRKYCSDICARQGERQNAKARNYFEKEPISAEQVGPKSFTKEDSEKIWKHHLEVALDEEARRALNVDTRHWGYFKTVNSDEVTSWKKKHRPAFFKKHRRNYSSSGSYFNW